ncbi:TetR/AcrR family transcriptional regulator [candidate division KSB1 bacterium]|nr:TetR/AcrR family transcriptional regulator [candidate division KSB1 bacterium]
MIVTDNIEQSTRKKIFIVAARLFAEKGYSAVSMREISEQAGLSKPTIYYYFGSKEGIYKELVTTGVSHILSAIESTYSLDLSVKEKLNLILKKFFYACQNFPEFTKFMSNLMCSAEKMDFMVNFRAQTNRKEKFLINLFRQGIRSGELDSSLDPKTAAHIYTGVLMHFIMIQLATKEIVLSDDLADNILNTLISGMRKL